MERISGLTYYIDINTNEEKWINGPAPFGTKEVVQIGFDGFGKTYSLPKTIEIVPNWISKDIKRIDDLFANCKKFNDKNICDWNTTNIQTMIGAFNNAESFNQPIEKWNVENVVSFSDCFKDAINFNQPLDGWNVKKCVIFSSMFDGAINFNQNLKSWNVSSGKYFDYMFAKTNKFNGDVSTWNVSEAEDLMGMFCEAKSFNNDISKWSTTCWERISSMFENAISFNQNLSLWECYNVIENNGLIAIENFDKNARSWEEFKKPIKILNFISWALKNDEKPKKI